MKRKKLKALQNIQKKNINKFKSILNRIFYFIVNLNQQNLRQIILMKYLLILDLKIS